MNTTEQKIAERTAALDEVQRLAAHYGFHRSATDKPRDLLSARRHAEWIGCDWDEVADATGRGWDEHALRTGQPWRNGP